MILVEMDRQKELDQTFKDLVKSQAFAMKAINDTTTIIDEASKGIVKLTSAAEKLVNQQSNKVYPLHPVRRNPPIYVPDTVGVNHFYQTTYMIWAQFQSMDEARAQQFFMYFAGRNRYRKEQELYC